MNQEGNVDDSPHHGTSSAFHDHDHHDDATPGNSRPQAHEAVSVVAYDERTFAASGRKCEAVEVGVPIDEGSAAQRFNRSQWDGIIRLLALAVLIPCILAARNARDFHNGTLHVSDATRRELHAMREWLPLAFGLTLLVAGFVFAAMRAFTEQFIIIANVLVIGFYAHILASTFAKGDVLMNVVGVVLIALSSVWLYLVRRHVRLAAVLLRTSVSLVTRHFGTLVATFASLAAGAAYLVVCIIVAAPVLSQFDIDSNYAPAWVAAVVLLVMSLFLVTLLCGIILYGTGGAVVATWYFGEAAMPPGLSAASATTFPKVAGVPQPQHPVLLVSSGLLGSVHFAVTLILAYIGIVASGPGASYGWVGAAVFALMYMTLFLCMRPVFGGVQAQLVCIATSPDVMAQTNPQYHDDVDAATQSATSTG